MKPYEDLSHIRSSNLSDDQLETEINRTRSRLGKRINNISRRPTTADQTSVDNYEELMDNYKQRFPDFSPRSGALPQSVDRSARVEFLTKLRNIDNASTSYVDTAESLMRSRVNQFGEGYAKLSPAEQSALWRLATRVKSEIPEYDSDQITEMVKQLSVDASKVSFKPVNGRLEVDFLEDINGNLYEPGDTGRGMRDLFDPQWYTDPGVSAIIDKRDIAYNERKNRFNKQRQRNTRSLT